MNNYKSFFAGIALCAIVSSLLVYFYNDVESSSESTQKPEQPGNVVVLSPEQIQKLGIQIVEPQPGTLQLQLINRGKIILHPDQVANILSKMPGVLKDAKKNLGDPVKKGEILAFLESAEIAEKKANYLTALGKENAAKELWEKENNLFQKRMSVLEDYLSAQAQSKESSLNVQIAKECLTACGLTEEEIRQVSLQNPSDLNIYSLRAPFEGVVIGRSVTKGDFVEPTSNLFQIADLSTVWVEIGIYPKDLPNISKGQNITVIHPHTEEQATAKLVYISPVIQDETTFSKALAELDNSKGIWLPGSFVQVVISAEPEHVALRVPQEALQTIDGKSCVFVKTNEGFEKRDVDLGRQDDRYFEILQGLAPTDKIAGNNTFILKADLGKESVEDND